MTGTLYQRACCREIALTLEARRGRRWVAVLESSAEAEIAQWLDSVCRVTAPDDRPQRVVLPRAPERWAEILGDRHPIALGGLSALSETRTDRFSESSAALKGVALVRAISSAPRVRLILTISSRDAASVQSAAPELLGSADAYYRLDFSLPESIVGARPIPAAPADRGLRSALEARASAQRALADSASPEVRARSDYWRLLLDLGRMEAILGSSSSAIERFARVGQAGPDVALRAEAYEAIGDTHLASGAPGKATVAYDYALSGFRRALPRDAVQRLLLRLGDGHLACGSFERALECFEEAQPGPRLAGHVATRLEGALRDGWARLGRAKDEGDARAQAVALSSLGRALTLLGRHGEAAERFAEGAALFAETGDRESQAEALGESGQARAQDGDLASALELHGAALAVLGDAVARVSRALPEHEPDPEGGGVQLPRRRHTKAALLRSLGELYRQQGDITRASEFEAAAAALADGSRPSDAGGPG